MTYGQMIAKLVKKYRSHGRMGVFVLEEALRKLVELDGIVEINGVLLQDGPGYKKLGVACEDPELEARVAKIVEGFKEEKGKTTTFETTYPGTKEEWDKTRLGRPWPSFVCVHCKQGPEGHGAPADVAKDLGIPVGEAHLICRITTAKTS